MNEPTESQTLYAGFVPGLPQSQGSKIAGVTKHGKPFLRDRNGTALWAWRTLVATHIHDATADYVEGACIVDIEFRLPRPATVTRELPSVAPDVDKLTRAILDAITESGLWRNDGQCTDLLVRKRYAAEPGAWIQIREWVG